jgi:hypothetical protein
MKSEDQLKQFKNHKRLIIRPRSVYMSKKHESQPLLSKQHALKGRQDLVGSILCLCQGDLQLLCLDILTVQVQLLAAV